jgi:hypothetical protein
MPILGTAEQVRLEEQALELRRHPTIVGALPKLADYWKSNTRASAWQIEQFEREMERATFCGLMDALNSDPRNPRIHAFGRLEHALNGEQVPATRTMHPNLDYIYRLVPLDADSKIRILGSAVLGRAPHAVEYALLTSRQLYEKTYALENFLTGSGTEFELTVDRRPAAGRPVHFTTSTKSHQLLLRDVIATVGELPLQLCIERAAGGQMDTFDAGAMAESAIVHIRRHIDGVLHINRQIAFARAANQFSSPCVHREGLYSASQAYSAGNYRIEDDECLVIELGLGGATYVTVPLTNIWGGTGEILQRRSNLSTAQAEPDESGKYTFIVSHHDPGHPNWVQSSGEVEGVMFMRWVGLKGTEPKAPTVSVTVCNMAQLSQSRWPQIDLKAVLEARANRLREAMG